MNSRNPIICVAMGWVLVLGVFLGSLPAYAQTTAPVGWWKFDEGTGTTAADSSGNGNTATLVNSPTWSTGHTGPFALTFNGSTTELTASGAGALTNLATTNGFTVSAWINPTGAGNSSAARIVDRDNNNGGWFLSMNGTTQVRLTSDIDTSGITSRTSTSTIALNTWQHVLATWNGQPGGANMHIYINGVLADGATTDGTGPELDDSGSPLTIGNRQLDKGRAFAGAIDEVRIFNKVLSATEIQALANTTAPTAPSGLSVTAASSTQLNLSWTASTDSFGVTQYLVERCQGAGCSNFAQIATPTGTTFNDTGLTASTSYSYRVRATDEAGNLSSYSSTSSGTTQGGIDTTPPTAPTGLSATATSSSQINLTWTASTDNVSVTGYRVERCAGSGCTSFAQIATPTSTSFSDTGLTASTTYSYRVRATDGAGNLSNYSSTASAATQAPGSGPVGRWKFDEGTGTTAADSSGNGNTATLVNSPTWSTGHTGPFALTFNGSTTELTASGAGALTNLATTNGFTVSAWINPTGAGNSSAARIVDRDNNNGGWFLSMNGTTQVKLTSDIDTSGITSRTSTSTIALNTWQHVLATWNGQPGGANMHIYINGVLADGATTDGTGPELDDSGSPLTIGNRQLDKGRAFAGAIDEVRIYNRVLSAAEIQALADGTPPTVPSALTAGAASSSQIDLSWNAATDNVGVTQYLLERCQGAGCSNFVQVATPTGLSYTDSGLSGSTSYSYRVRATDAAGNLGAYSSAATTSTPAATIRATTVNYSYDDAGRLRVVAYDDGGNFTYAYDAAGNRIQIQSSIDVTPPSVPTGLAGTVVSAFEIDLTWAVSTDSQSGVGGYQIYRGTSPTSLTLLANSLTATYQDKTVVGSSKYTYAIAAVDNVGKASAQSTSVTLSTPDVTPPSVPTNVTASAPAFNQVNLSWSASTDNSGGSGLKNYNIYRNGVSRVYATTTQTSYQDTGVVGSTTYSYTVAAVDNAGNVSAKSSPAASIPTPPAPDTTPPSVPTNLAATAVSPVEVDLSWTPSVDTDGCGVAGYHVFRGGTSPIASVTTTSFADTSLSEVTTYTYTVTAFDCKPNESAHSTAVSVTTPQTVPTVPTGLSGPTRTIFTGKYTVSWNSSTAAGSTLANYMLFETNLATNFSTTFTITAPTTSMSFDKGANGSDFTYQVKACTVRNSCSAFSSPPIEVITCPAAGCP